jgi:hypothetical protein
LAINSLPKALNPFADWPKYIQELAAMMAGLKLAIPSLPNQTGPSKYDVIQSNLTSEFINLGIESGAAQGLAASSARLQAQADAYFKANPNIDPMTGKDITVNVQIGNQQITDFVTSAQVNNSASGISTKVNRLSLID